MEKGIHVSSAHILGKQNILADTVSRKSHDVSERMLSKNIFSHLVASFGMHEVDFFASRLNRNLHRYISWMSDPDALYDAMSMSWENHFVYLFPPFSMIWLILKKTSLESIKASIVIAPMWPTQSWFNKLLDLAVEQSMSENIC